MPLALTLDEKEQIKKDHNLILTLHLNELKRQKWQPKNTMGQFSFF